MLALPGVVTLFLTLWGITGASYWRDEAATLSAAQRPFGNLLRTFGNIDAVHGAYYVLIWAMVKLGGTGELATRLPPAAAMAVAAAAGAPVGGPPALAPRPRAAPPGFRPPPPPPPLPPAPPPT